MVIDEESNSERETNYLGYEVNVHDIEIERTFVVETVDDEKEVDTAVNRRYPNKQRHKTTRYEPTFQGKRYEDYAGAILINYRDTLVSTGTKED